MLAYPASFTKDEEGITIRFRDFPEALSFADDREEAERIASDALEEVLAGRMNRREDIHSPSELLAGEVLVFPPSQTAIKAFIWKTMRDMGLRKADLARLLTWDERQVDRLLNPHHASRMGHIDTALAALGKRLVVEVRDAA